MKHNQKPRRVLHVLYSLNRGGAEMLVYNILKNINTEKVIFDFLLFVPRVSSLEEEVKAKGCKIHKLPYFHTVGLKGFSKELIHFFKNNQYEVVHSHLNEISALVLKPAKKYANAYCVAHCHLVGQYDFKRKILKSYLVYQLKKYCDFYMSCSQDAHNWLFGHNIKPEKFTILFNGIPIKEYEKILPTRRHEIRQEYRIKEGEVVLGNVAGFRPQKNHDFLLDIAFELAKINNKYKFVLIGGGELEQDIKDKILHLKLDNVKLVGEKSDIPEQMSAFDLFIFPSHYEGLGIVLIEAQASQLPCLIKEGLPIESDMGLDLMNKLTIESSAKDWANKIVEISDQNQEYEKKKVFENIRENGYDIVSSSQFLEKFYTDIK